MLSIRENLLETIRGGHPDRFVKQFEYQNWIGDPMMGIYMGKMQKGGQWKTGWGVTMIMPEQGPGAFPLCDNMHKVIKDVAHWRDYVEAPDIVLGDTAWEEYIAKAERVDRHEQFVTATVFNGIFEKAHFMLGLEDTMIAMYEEPEAYKELIDRITDYKVELIGIIGKYYKPDVLCFHDDYGSNDRMLMSVELWEEFFKEPLKRVIEETHRQGIIYEHHSCGYIEPIFDQLVELGIDAIDPLQISNPVRQLKDKYQDRVTFVGGYDNQNVFDKVGVTEEEIRGEVRRILKELAPGGSFVAFPLTVTYDFVPIFIDEHMKHAFS